MTIQRMLATMVSTVTLCVLFTLSAFSQSKTITGKVSDDKGSPIQGATVTAKGTKSGASTGADGSYKLTIPAGTTTLVFTSVGYTSQELPIGDNATIDATLAGSSQGLNEIVVIGYGSVRKKDATGSVVSVKPKDFNQGVITSPDQLLQGKVAGLEITNNSGQPGAGTTIKIRGNNSIRTANNPLYVIDGVALDGRTARPPLDLGKSGLGFGPTPESNPLLYINPNDIAQIDVLKDASATAIYGSRGANGIIVITTKRGSSGNTKLEFNTSLGTQAGYMKKYKILTADEFRAQAKKSNLAQDSGYSVDALKEITQHTLTQNYSLAFSGGNEAGKFRASFLGSKTAGLLKKTELDKYLGNFGGTYNFIDKRLIIDFDLIAGHTTENMGLISNTTGAGGNVLSWALNWNPTLSFKDPKTGLYRNKYGNDFSIPNPMAAIDAFSDVADVNVFLANVSATVKILDNLDYKFLYAINHGTGTRKTNIDGWLDGVQGITSIGFGGISNASINSQTFTHTLNYRTTFTDKLRFDAVVGYEYWKTDYSSGTLAGTGFNTNLDQATKTGIPYTNFLQNAQQQYPYTPSVDPRAEIQSYFGRVNFNLDDKYYITGTFRADGSNKFGSNNKYGYFPSVGAKWNISNEEFLKSSNTVSNLSLRGSWGITGNQEFPSGASLAQFSSTAYNNAGQTNVFNPDLKWEKTTTVNIGLDFSFMKNKIYGSLDWYRKNTTNLLFQSTAIQPAPASIYFINLPANLINKGFEFSIGSTIVQQKDFNWDFAVNIAYNKNKLTNFSQAPIPTGKVSGNGVSGVLAQRIANNQPVDVFWLKHFSGFDQNGQQVVADTSLHYAGNPNPTTTLGFSTTLRYRKLSLGLNVGGSFGFMIYNNTLNTVTNIGQFTKGQNVAKSNFTTAENITSGAIASDRYLESGNYVKLRNATLTYAFGDVGRYVHNLSIFASGTNLFVITKFKGFDPEVNIDVNNNSYPSRSMEYLPYPTPRIITVGVNLGL